MKAGETLANGRYQISQRLGQGGFGSVYRATDTVLGREVAIKMVASPTPELRERFLREAKAIARLDHPHIIKIWDVGVVDEDLFIVQELLRGASLDVVFASRAPLPPRVALDILIQTGEALAFAHGQGVIHRDFKPGNVFILEPLNAKLLDFGVAKLSDQSNITKNLAVGTPYYASPEQLQGFDVDARTDIYAFGAVAFEALSGQKLFQGSGEVIPTVLRVLRESPPSLADVVPDASPALVDLVARCVTKDRNERPASMDEVVERLRGSRKELGGPVTAEEWPPLIPTTSLQAPGPPPALPPSTGTVIGPVIAPPSPGDPVATPPAFTPPLASDDVALNTQMFDTGLPGGTRVGRYTVHELVARGRTGHLYKAFDPVRSMLVGLKVIRSPSGVTIQRLLRASRIWLDLHHANLQRILEVDPGEQSGVALIATELIEGIDLAGLLKARQLDLVQKIQIAIQVCAALEYMHAAGIVHREIKPTNIVVSGPGLHVKILDSGLARSSNALEASLTQTGMIVGDLRYMAPEQAAGRHDQRSDIYSLGVVLYEMVLEQPFEQMPLDTLQDRLTKAENMPASLAVMLATALCPAPSGRFESVPELADGLRALVPEKPLPLRLSDIVVSIHGIRTHARWQRAFAEVASRAGLHCRLDRWNFGYFSVLQFLAPWSRQAKVDWFRITYHDEFREQVMSPLSSERPSVVAHSFGTYILGNALMRYPFLRFNKVLLCGSILPADFPWDVLIDRGQVQAVRNEHGARDIWATLARRFVPGTGPSGLDGFSCKHARLEQERFDYSHSEYFERGHMEAKWVPFIKRRVSHITPRERPATVPKGVAPVGLYALYAVVALAMAWLARAAF